MFWPPLSRPVYLSTKMSKFAIQQPKSVLCGHIFSFFLGSKLQNFLQKTKVSPKLDASLSHIFVLESEFESIPPKKQWVKSVEFSVFGVP